VRDQNFVANSTTDGCWREHHTNKHEGKRHTDESKNEAVAGMLTVGFFRSSLGRCPFGGAMTWSPPKFQIGTPDNIRLLGNICD
jgi:hypothetical protein